MRGRLFTDPVEVLVARTAPEVPAVLERVEEAAREGLWAVGYVAYEAAPAFDPVMPVRGDGRMPAAWFGLFREPAPVPDTVGPDPGPAAAAGRDEAGPDLGPDAVRWRPTRSRQQYVAAVRRAQAAIRRGDFYQVNHSCRLRADVKTGAGPTLAGAAGGSTPGSPGGGLPSGGEASAGPAPGPGFGPEAALYRRLRASQARGYHALLHTGRHRVVSVSPELFFHREPLDDLRSPAAASPSGGTDGPVASGGSSHGPGHGPAGWRLLSRPMKGTAARGRWLEEDEARARRLAASPKERAENLMIVDLVRNDLSRIARPGTVRVPELFRVERYPTVLQMTSDVAAALDADVGLGDVFGALFPAGSVTGAPKIRAMRHIARTEATPREVYCGAVGIVEPGGRATFNVAIRTAWVDGERGRAEYGIGGAVTHDSDPGRERDEAEEKAAVLSGRRPAFDLLETLRLEDGELVRVDRHLARLAASARYFGFEPPEERARAALWAEAERHPEGLHRLRLTAGPGGEVAVERSPAPEPAPGPRPVALSREPVSRGNRLLYHKTTHRAPYRRRRQRTPDVFDVLLRNQQGELTEFTRGNLVLELEGGLWTPPRDCGLLAGTFRDELVDEGRVRERHLHPPHLERAERVWLVNSLREWVEATLVEGEAAGDPG